MPLSLVVTQCFVVITESAIQAGSYVALKRVSRYVLSLDTFHGLFCIAYSTAFRRSTTVHVHFNGACPVYISSHPRNDHKVIDRLRVKVKEWLILNFCTCTVYVLPIDY